MEEQIKKLLRLYEACETGQARVIEHMNPPWKFEAAAWRDLYLARKLIFATLLSQPREAMYHDIIIEAVMAKQEAELVMGRLDDVYDSEGLKLMQDALDAFDA